MIGNDVVDIAQAVRESNWQRKGFIEKVFTPSEQSAILSNSEPELLVWVLWSMKEAAYKIYNRQSGVRAFIPHKLECKFTALSLSYTEGTVTAGTATFYTKTEINAGVVKTISVIDPADFLNVQEVEMTAVIKDASGLPCIVTTNGIVPVSVSHHGNARQVVMLRY